MYGSVNEYDIQHDPPFAFHVVFPERKKKVRYYDFNNLDHKGDKKTMDVHLLQFIIWLFIIGFGMLVLSQLFFYKTNFNLSSYTGAEEGPGCMQHNCATLIQGATTSEKGSKGLGVSNCMNYFDLQKTEQCLDQSKSVFAAKIKLCGVCNNCFTSDGPKPEECKDLPSMKPGGSWWPNPPKTKSEVDNALRGKTTDSPAKTGPTKDSTPSSPVIQPNVPATTETPTAPVGGAYDSMFKNLTSKIFGDVGKLMDAGTEKYTTNNSPAAVSSTANIYMKQNSKPSFSDSVAKPAFDDSVSKPSFADSVSDFLGKQKAAFSGKEVVRDTKTTDPTKSNSFNWKKYLGGGTTAGGGKDDVDYAGKYKGYADKYKEYVPSDYSNSFNVKSQATDVTPSEINFNAEPQITAVDKSSLLTAVFGKKIIASPETLTKLASNPNWDELIGGKNKKYAEEKEKSLKKYSDQYKGYAKDFGFDFNVAEAAV